MLRTVNDQPTVWDAILPVALLVLPVELGRLDELVDDPVFFVPFAPFFDARIGGPLIPMETYLQMMFSEVPLPVERCGVVSGGGRFDFLAAGFAGSRSGYGWPIRPR